MSTTYAIFNVSELPFVDFSEILESSPNTLRYSLDRTKSSIKWNGTEPNFIKNMSSIEGPYTLEEILPIMDGIEWTEPDNLI